MRNVSNAVIAASAWADRRVGSGRASAALRSVAAAPDLDPDLGRVASLEAEPCIVSFALHR
jgi:hypothetical protein